VLEKLPESIGHALVNQRAGMENVVYNALHQLRSATRIELKSPAFVFNGRLPTRFTADGEGLSPPLEWESVPAGTDSLVMIVEDADSPTPHPLVHAIVTGLPGGNGVPGILPEGALDSPNHHGVGLPTGQNSFLQHAWLPPDPPRGHGEHRYVFQVFALRAGEPFAEAPGRRALIDAILGRAIGVGCLIGTYERSVRQDVDTSLHESVGLIGGEAAGGLGTA
jgi:Raf kinase inhibitor-like YbhB/YbcL family protein